MYLKKIDYIYFKQLLGERVSITEMQLEDEGDLFAMFSNPNVTRNLALATYEHQGQAKELIIKAINQYRNKEIFYLGIRLRGNNKIIGYIGLSRHDLSEISCQIVYALNEKYWGFGLMAEAVSLFINYLFLVQNKQIIIATHIDRNVNSGKVMLKAGMIRDHNFDQDMVIKGKTEKLIGYSIKRS